MSATTLIPEQNNSAFHFIYYRLIKAGFQVPDGFSTELHCKRVNCILNSKSPQMGLRYEIGLRVQELFLELNRI